MNHEHVAVVLDLSANGIGIIRGLARKGIKVYAYDNEKAYKIGKSRLASCGVCPSPLYKEKELLVFLVDLAKNFKEKPVLYTGADDYLVFISKYQKELSEYYLFFIPEQSLVEQIVDKEKMYELAKKHNIPCPKTYMIERDEEFELVIEDLTFPCILKPVMGHEFRKKVNQKAILVQDADQLRSQYQLFQQHGKLLIQEIIPGDNQCFYKVATFYDDNMELLALFSLQKNHQFPAEFGTGAHIVSKQVPELVEMCLPFFQELKLKGIGMIEFKKDPRDGVYKFIEINPRFWLTHSLTRRAGIDFVYMYYLYVTNQEVIPQLQQNDGVKWIYLVRYYLTFRHKKQKGEMTWKEFYKGLKGQKEFALFAWDDPMPFIRSAYSHLINAWKRKRKE
ncbi:carbamoyl-phosphate synthase [Bacillus sp. CH126_4D]|uniref:carboxylate--amine ligase n=1 Tax=unclassified Bacillus (in: firmicutes) TaxID=185979 RepID=UPI00124DC139|nr:MULTISPECIES: carbamoyl-phosphate synthase [unclassified Bacillus (in: firmicutes)]KAB2460519.1 carbamoyl-phosphate synthase [Bacillus sp. CH140a_4T]KAB2468596.1 carbamoyl-phosphate synthase [Bacillus sp. CH126_4D]